MPSLTNDEYLRTSGNKCPSCGSSDISAQAIEAEGTEAWSSVQCNTCSSNWHDVYTLTGYIELEEPGREID